MRRELRDPDKKTDHLGFDDYVVNGWWLQGRQTFYPQVPEACVPRAVAVHPKGRCGSPQGPLRFKLRVC